MVLNPDAEPPDHGRDAARLHPNGRLVRAAKVIVVKGE